MFAVVERDRHLLCAERVGDGFDVAGTRVVEAERIGDRGDELAAADGGQRHEPGPGRHVGVGAPEQFFGEAGLAHAARADQRHEIARSNEFAELDEFGRAAHEGVVPHGYVARVREPRDDLGGIVDRADRRVGCGDTPTQLAQRVARNETDLGERVVRPLVGA